MRDLRIVVADRGEQNHTPPQGTAPREGLLREGEDITVPTRGGALRVIRAPLQSPWPEESNAAPQVATPPAERAPA